MMKMWDTLVTCRPPEGRDLDQMTEGLLSALEADARADAWTVTANTTTGTVSVHFGVTNEGTMAGAAGLAAQIFHDAATSIGWDPDEARVEIDLVGVRPEQVVLA